MSKYCRRCGEEPWAFYECGSCGQEFCSDCAHRQEVLDELCWHCIATARGVAPPLDDAPDSEVQTEL